jgi:hypothetical protein
MRIEKEALFSGVKETWQRYDAPNGNLYVEASSTDVVSLSSDAQVVYRNVADYCKERRFTFLSTRNGERVPIGKDQVPPEHAIFWEELDEDDRFMVPISGMNNKLTLLFMVTGVDNGNS